MGGLDFRKLFLCAICLSIFSTAVLFLSPITSTRAALSEIGLVAHWKFDEGGGRTALDFSGNGNQAVLVNGPAWKAGRINTALEFDGLDDYLQVQGLSSYSDFTLAGWIRLNDQSSKDPDGNHTFFERDSRNNRVLIRPSGYYIEFTSKYGQRGNDYQRR